MEKTQHQLRFGNGLKPRIGILTSKKDAQKT